MAAATASIDTPERSGETLSQPVAASTLIPAGVLVALDTAGRAVNASDAANLRVIGRCEADADNAAGSAGDINAAIKRGVFKFANSGTAAVDADDVGKICYVEDNQTVAETSTNKCKAGIVVAVEDDGVWVDTRFAHLATQVVTLGSTNGTAGAAADLTALKAEAELIGDDVRAIHAALVVLGILK